MMTFVKLMTAILLLQCLAPMPYGYYQLVRFVAMVVFAIMTFNYYKEKKNELSITFGALARKEMRNRYKRNKGEEKHKIAIAFNNSTKGDQQWIKSQKRKEEYERIYGKPYPEWKPWYNHR